jgi:hypothetical protein
MAAVLLPDVAGHGVTADAGLAHTGGPHGGGPKDDLRIATIGNVDAGKSTLVRRKMVAASEILRRARGGIGFSGERLLACGGARSSPRPALRANCVTLTAGSTKASLPVELCFI